MNICSVDFNPIYINDIQDMEGIEYINVDKENSETLISIYHVYY